MPKSGNLPSFIPSFSVDPQSGGLEANPAGSVAVAKMERLLRNRDEASSSFLSEQGLQARRQATVSKYYRGESRGEKVPMGVKGSLRELPMVASPQPIHLFKSTATRQNVLNKRESQLRDFGDSFMKVNAPFIHKVIDEALQKCGTRGEEVKSKQKGANLREIFKSERQKKFDGGFSKKEKEYVFAPLEEAISWLNKVFLEDKEPVQVRWREVWKGEGESSKELYMIFPTAEYQWKKPQSTWNGMAEVVE